ncbi:MAG: hypothetical protein P9L94_12200 [Candidatus Hinthialibacter antarcticus]|nr:hypothetical protein [Candidatus Hinthialibacter antarcticus]
MGRPASLSVIAAKRTALTIILTVVLFQLRWLPLLGADAPYMVNYIETDAFPLFYRSLLTLWIHRAVYVALSPLGFDGWSAISVSSALAGAGALQALWAMKPDVRFLALNVLCGSFLVLVGHVENYAWVNFFLLASMFGFQCWFENRAPVWPAMVCFVLACLAHMLALFYIPAIAYALYGKRRFQPLEILLPVLVFVFVVIACSLSLELHGTELGLERLMPLFSAWAPNHFDGLTLFSWEHVKILAFFHYHAAYLALPIHYGPHVWEDAWVVGVPVELILLFILRKRIDTPYLRFLLVCSACGLFWTVIWHPDWGPHDWDLFSQFGIPLHVLLGLLILKGNQDGSEIPHEPEPETPAAVA